MGTKCNSPDCSRRASYAMPGNAPKFCQRHAHSGCINTKTNRCSIRKCFNFPTFSCPNGKPVFCDKHKIEGCIPMTRHGRCHSSTTESTWPFYWHTYVPIVRPEYSRSGSSSRNPEIRFSESREIKLLENPKEFPSKFASQRLENPYKSTDTPSFIEMPLRSDQTVIASVSELIDLEACPDGCLFHQKRIH